MMATIADRVAAGARYLDDADPDWWRENVSNAIDLSELDLAYGDMCVLGQRCPVSDYSRQLRKITGSPDSQPSTVLHPWAVAHGFTMDQERGHWATLTAEWRRVIRARRRAARPSQAAK